MEAIPGNSMELKVISEFSPLDEIQGNQRDLRNVGYWRQIMGFKGNSVIQANGGNSKELKGIQAIGGNSRDLKGIQ